MRLMGNSWQSESGPEPKILIVKDAERQSKFPEFFVNFPDLN